MKRLVLIFSICALVAVVDAQVSKKLPPASSTKKQLAPEEEQWCSVIESALAGTADLQPAMRSFVLDAIAGSLKKCDPGTVRRVLVDSFTATLAMPETEESIAQQSPADAPIDQAMMAWLTNLDVKQHLQIGALTDLFTVDEAKVESLLPRSEPSVRETLLNLMISRATEAKKLDRALNLLNQMPSALRFPYDAATNLMLELPPQRDPNKQEIFQRAMAADREQHSMVIGGDDFASMIVRFWKHVPPAVALEAIHQVLDGARSNKEQISLGSGSDKVIFSNEYEFRVFEFLPILRPLDKDEADKILNDSQQAQAQLQRLPNGIQSLYPTIRDTPLKKGESPRMRGMVGQAIGPMLQEGNAADAYSSRVAEIGRIAENNPKQAIAAAAGLPASAGSLAPRAKALLAIARVAMKKNPSAARDALEEMSESLKNGEPSGHEDQMNYWTEGIDIATQIGEIDLAKKLLKAGMDQAESLKRKDTDANDPNLALKAWWPSAAALSRLMLVASHISPQTALDAIAEISDPELHILCQVTLASRQLGVRAERSVVMFTSQSSRWAEFGGREK